MVIEDALAANAPHVREVERHGMDFLVVAKPDDNASLFDAVGERLTRGLCTEWEGIDAAARACGYRFTYDVALNRAAGNGFGKRLTKTKL